MSNSLVSSITMTFTIITLVIYSQQSLQIKQQSRAMLTAGHRSARPSQVLRTIFQDWPRHVVRASH